MVDLKILANLAVYHSRRIPAGLSYALFERTHDRNALDDAIAHEKRAVEAWEGIVRAAGDVYNSDLKMGLAEFDLSGSWKDELVKLKAGVAALETQRAAFHPQTGRPVGRYDLTSVFHAGKGAQQAKGPVFETDGRNLITLAAPDGRYRIEVAIEDPQKSHGPMWIEVNGTEYSDVFSVPAGRRVERSLETSAVDGKLKILFDNATSADWYASTLAVTRVDPLIATVPVRRLRAGAGPGFAGHRQRRGSDCGRAGLRGRLAQRIHGGRNGMCRARPLSRRHPGRQGRGRQLLLSGSRGHRWPDRDLAGGRALHPVAVQVTGDSQPATLRHTRSPRRRPVNPCGSSRTSGPPPGSSGCGCGIAG